MKRFSLLFLMIAFFSLCFFVKPVFADSAKAITLQDTSNFIGTNKNNDIANNHQANIKTTIWAFTTNPSQNNNATVDSDVTLTVYLENSQNLKIGDPYYITIPAYQSQGSVDVTFPTNGQWKIYAEGVINSKNDKKQYTVNYTTNLFWVGLQLNLSPSNASIIKGNTQQFTAVLKYPDNSTVDVTRSVTWTSSDSNIAAIDSNGLATGKSPGTVTITAADSFSGLSQNAQLKVNPDRGLEIVFNPPPIINVNDTKEYRANYFYYKNGSRITLDVTDWVYWNSSDSAIASIDFWNYFSGNGVVATGHKPGICTITGSNSLPFSLYFTLNLAKYMFDPNFDLSLLSDLNLYSASTTLEVDLLSIIPSEPQTIDVGKTLQYQVMLTDSNMQITNVTNSAQWTTLNSSIASIDNSNMKGLATGVSAGTTTITATYNGISVSANLAVQKTQTVDHFGFVNSSGSSIPYPNLNLRSDVNAPNSNWAYIGEPMQIDVYLKAYTKDGVPVSNYNWDTDWFSNLNNWNISPSANSINKSLLSISGSDSTLHALIEIRVNDSNLEQVIQNFSVTLKPTDSSGISTPMATPAVVPNQGTTYTLYDGRIRVAQSYFYQVNGMAQVYVEKYDGQFVQNKDDSQTSVSTWDLSGTTVSTPNFIFLAGSGQVSVSSDASNVTKTLTPTGFPTYLRPVPGTLTWGQIVNNPPPQQNEGTVWERELPP